MRWVAAIVLGFVLGCVIGSSAQPGVRGALERQREQNLATCRQQIAQIVDQLMVQLSTEVQTPERFRTELKAMGTEAAESVANAYTVDEALAVYARAWDRNYPGDQLDLARADLSTPEGQRLVRTVSESTSEMSQFVQSRQQAAMQRETNRMVQRMRELLKRAAEGAQPSS